MKYFAKKNGYSESLAREIVDVEKEFLVISPKVFVVKKYDKNTKTYLDEIDCYKIKVVQRGNEDFYVKFLKEIDVKQFDKVKFKNLQAIEISRNVYFKAEDVEVVSYVKL